MMVVWFFVCGGVVITTYSILIDLGPTAAVFLLRKFWILHIFLTLLTLQRKEEKKKNGSQKSSRYDCPYRIFAHVSCSRIWTRISRVRFEKSLSSDSRCYLLYDSLSLLLCLLLYIGQDSFTFAWRLNLQNLFHIQNRIRGNGLHLREYEFHESTSSYDVSINVGRRSFWNSFGDVHEYVHTIPLASLCSTSSVANGKHVNDVG